MKEPCPLPLDPEQKLKITCAHCGVPIDFRRREVFLNATTSSYVCHAHAGTVKPFVAMLKSPTGLTLSVSLMAQNATLAAEQAKAICRNHTLLSIRPSP